MKTKFPQALRRLAIPTLCFCAMFPFISAHAGSATSFQIGERVQALGRAPIWFTPPTAGYVIGKQMSNAPGSITDGPVRAGEAWWWQVDFDRGLDGWISDRQLRDFKGPSAVQTRNPPAPQPTPSVASFVTLLPQAGSTVSNPKIVLQGTVTNDVFAPGLVSFSVNGAGVALDRSGRFSLPVTLRPGRNPFSLQATTPNPRQQTNQISGYLDGSVIYGTDAARAAALRTVQGGQLATSESNLPPLNTGGLANANDAHLFPDDELFLAGDVRANENVELTAIQTLFLREHNQIASAIAAANPAFNDEQIFQQARRLVVAELQVITYREFLPALLGPNALKPYAGYQPDVNPGIATEFSTAAYRIGHTLINDDVEFLDNDANPVRDEIELAEAFFNPEPLKETGPDPILKYLATDNAQEVDLKLIPSLRNFLFGPPGAGGFDLASLNIQRGRDHGLADYNRTRAAYGLPRVTSFAEITSDADLQAKLAALYGNVDSIDLWVGGLAEDHAVGSSVGPTFQKIIANQFERVRDGDRMWYQQTFSGRQLQTLEQTRLSDIIRRNTTITKLQDNVFFYQESALPTLPVRTGVLPPALIFPLVYRPTFPALDGTGNNVSHPNWGSAGVDLMRFAPASYGDSISSPAGADRPSARLISNTVSEQTDVIPNARNLSDWIYGWGQFIDHDLDLTPSGDVALDIAVPQGDPYFDPASTGAVVIYFSRSVYDAATGTSTSNVQQQSVTINFQPPKGRPLSLPRR